jgi:hypothetical protein
VPVTEAATAQLAAALAELHSAAGWSCDDSGMDVTGYFTRALRLGGEAGDAYGTTNAAIVTGGGRWSAPQRRAQAIPARAISPRVGERTE